MVKKNNQTVRQKIRLRRGDTVIVLAGKDAGKKGKILKVYPLTNRVLVERVNFAKKHVRPTQANPKGGIIEQELPIAVAKVSLFCDKCNAGRRTRSLVLEDGRKTRVCVKCGETLSSEESTK